MKSLNEHLNEALLNPHIIDIITTLLVPLIPIAAGATYSIIRHKIENYTHKEDNITMNDLKSLAYKLLSSNGYWGDNIVDGRLSGPNVKLWGQCAEVIGDLVRLSGRTESETKCLIDIIKRIINSKNAKEFNVHSKAKLRIYLRQLEDELGEPKTPIE